MRTSEENRIRGAVGRVTARLDSLPSIVECSPDEYVETVRCEAIADTLAWVLGDDPAWEFGPRATAQEREDNRERSGYVKQSDREP